MVIQPISASLTRPLRHLVLWPHLPSVSDCTTDVDDREDTIHLGAFQDGQLVAIGTFFPQGSPKLKATRPFRLRAMASHPQSRGTGAAMALIQYSLRMLPALGADALWCDARIAAVGFYEKAGLMALPEVYEVPSIGPHQFMFIHFSTDEAAK